jgi:hypothetical protein
MSRFVNYKKRSVTLPVGCKDLIDVLESWRRRGKNRDPLGDTPCPKFEEIHLGDLPVPKLKEVHFPTKGLAEVGRFVAMMLQSRAAFFMLTLTAPKLPFGVTLYRSDSERTAAICFPIGEEHWEAAIRAFFKRLGFEPLCDRLSQPEPLCWLEGGEPDRRRVLIYPLPFDASPATSLTMELLESVLGLDQEAGLDLAYFEWGSAA